MCKILLIRLPSEEWLDCFPLAYFLLRYTFIGWFKASWARSTNKKTASLDGALCSCSVIRSIYPDLQMRIEHLFQEHFNIQISTFIVFIDILTFRIYICVIQHYCHIDFFAQINKLFHLFLTILRYGAHFLHICISCFWLKRLTHMVSRGK